MGWWAFKMLPFKSEFPWTAQLMSTSGSLTSPCASLARHKITRNNLPLHKDDKKC